MIVFVVRHDTIEEIKGYLSDCGIRADYDSGTGLLAYGGISVALPPDSIVMFYPPEDFIIKPQVNIWLNRDVVVIPS